VSVNFNCLGPVTLQNLAAGAVDGMRLAAIILAVALATILANPRKLLKSLPGALFEVASAISVAFRIWHRCSSIA
jgi:energy-coupling factor transport system permease protein